MISRRPHFHTFLMLLVISTCSLAEQTSRQHDELERKASEIKLHINGIGIHFDKGENTNEQNWGLGIQGSLARYQSKVRFLEGWDLFWEIDAYQDSYSDVALSAGVGMQKRMFPYLDFGLKAGLLYEEGLKEDTGSNVLPFLALFRLVWARGQARLVTLGPRRGPTAAVETWLDGHCQRTPCGQSGDVASDRGGKPGTTLKCFSLLGRDVPRVAPGLPPLIPPLPTLRRARPAAGPGRLRRNNNWLSDCSDTNGLAAYPHQTEQTPFSVAVRRDPLSRHAELACHVSATDHCLEYRWPA